MNFNNMILLSLCLWKVYEVNLVVLIYSTVCTNSLCLELERDDIDNKKKAESLRCTARGW